nr:tigger transposable element-derived protein 2-like [Cherax quadricarinatus]
MAPKKAPSAKPVVKKVRNTIEFKKTIIEQYESGTSVAEVSRMYKKPYTTLCSIVAKKKEIKDAVVAKGVTMLTKMRSLVLEEVEKLLLVWINEKQLAGDTLMTSIICEKARQLHEDLVKKLPANSGDVGEFKASKGWFERFKNRTGIHSVIFTMWGKMESFMEKNHPNKVVASHIGNMYSDKVLGHFREVLKSRQKQSSLHSYFARQDSIDSQGGPSGIKKQRRQATPEKQLVPEVLMEGDSPSKL